MSDSFWQDENFLPSNGGSALVSGTTDQRQTNGVETTGEQISVRLAAVKPSTFKDVHHCRCGSPAVKAGISSVQEIAPKPTVVVPLRRNRWRHDHAPNRRRAPEHRRAGDDWRGHLDLPEHKCAMMRLQYCVPAACSTQTLIHGWVMQCQAIRIHQHGALRLALPLYTASISAVFW